MKLKKPNIYVLGTGRCGTTSLATAWGGIHEPEPDIVYEGTQYYLGNTDVYKDLQQKLETRKRLPQRVIVDHKHSTVLPMLQEVDPKAEYVLLVREPMTCIESFYARGAYRKNEPRLNPLKGAQNRLHPITGFPKEWTAFMKCTWYWVEVHRVILSTIGDTRFSIMFTDDISDETVRNQSKEEQRQRLQQKQQRGLSEQERNFYETYALPMWEEIQKLRDTLRVSQP